MLGLVAMMLVPPTSRVTYACRAARASVVLQELSKATGRHLETSPQTENEILVIKVDDVPVEDLLQRIATVTSGEWKQESNGLRLVGNLAVRRREERSQVDARIRELSSSTKERRQSFEKAEAEIAKASKVAKKEDLDEIAGKEITERMFLTILEGLDVADLAVIQPTDRLVYSTNPTVTQRRLPDSTTQAIQEFVKVHDAVVLSPAEIAAKYTDPDEADAAREANKPFGSAVKANVIVTEGLDDLLNKTCRLEVDLLDKKGSLIHKEETGVGPNWNAQNLDNGDKSPPDETPPYISRRVLDKNIGSKALLPVQFDPLSFVMTDDVMLYAAAKGKPLVADLPDDCESSIFPFMVGSPVLTEPIRQQFDMKGAVKVLPDAEFTAIMPSSPPHSRASRLARQPLQTLLRSWRENSVPRLAEVIGFTQSEPAPVTMTCLDTLWQWSVASSSQNGDRDWLKVFAGLETNFKTILDSGGRIPVREVGPEVKRLLEFMVYSEPVDMAPPGSGPKSLSDIVADYVTPEPTEVCPSGLPTDAFLEIKTWKEPFAVRVASTHRYFPIPPPTILDATRVAYDVATNEAATGPHPDLSHLRVGQATHYRLTLYLTPNAVLSGEVIDHDLPPDAKPVALKDLPDDFKTLIASKMDEVRAVLRKTGDADQQGDRIHP